MFDHAGIHVAELARSRAFYEAALAPLGIRLLQDNATGSGGWLVFGTGPSEPFFVVACDPSRAPDRIHLAFSAPDEAAVRAFHAAGLDAGGADNGAPGPRPTPPPGSYVAAYLHDPDGNNVEAGFRSTSA